MKSKRNLIINQDFFLKSLDDRIVIVDGGARGEVFSPFNKIRKDAITVIRFEPDSNDDIVQNENEIIYNKAIWNKETNLKLYVSNEETASSVYPNNLELFKFFEDNVHTEPRTTKYEIDNIPASTIDSMLSMAEIKGIDFIKLDIHASEYEALCGAIENLKNFTTGVIVETWSLPVHKGQKCNGAVENLLNEYGLYLFEYTQISECPRKFNVKVQSKLQITMLEALYFKDVLSEVDLTDRKSVLKLIALSDIYGHIAYALQINERYKALIGEEIHSKIQAFLVQNNKVSKKYSLLRKIIERLKRIYSDY